MEIRISCKHSGQTLHARIQVSKKTRVVEIFPQPPLDLRPSLGRTRKQALLGLEAQALNAIHVNPARADDRVDLLLVFLSPLDEGTPEKISMKINFSPTRLQRKPISHRALSLLRSSSISSGSHSRFSQWIRTSAVDISIISSSYMESSKVVWSSKRSSNL